MPADVVAETRPMLSAGNPARSMSGGPSSGTDMLAKELTICTIEVATSALAHRGNLKFRFRPSARPSRKSSGPPFWRHRHGMPS